MKYAYVLVHHIGDEGEATEGRILHVSNERFGELGDLVREATADEVEAGYVPPFEKDATTAPDAPAEGEKQKPAPANKKAAEPSNKGA